MVSKKNVAIKFLKVHSGTSKRKALECLHREIKILSECDHHNIVKILDSSFEGCLTKEIFQENSERGNF